MSRGLIEQEIIKYQQKQEGNRSNSLPNSNISRQLKRSSGKSIDSALLTYKCKCGNSRLSGAATLAIASDPIPIPVTTNITQEKRCSCNDHYRYKLSTWEMYHRIQEHRKKSTKIIHKSTCTHSSPTDTVLTQNQCTTTSSSSSSSSSAWLIDSRNNESVKRDIYGPSPTNNKNGSDYDNEEMLWELEM
jgi:hypothetical protein